MPRENDYERQVTAIGESQQAGEQAPVSRASVCASLLPPSNAALQPRPAELLGVEVTPSGGAVLFVLDAESQCAHYVPLSAAELADVAGAAFRTRARYGVSQPQDAPGKTAQPASWCTPLALAGRLETILSTLSQDDPGQARLDLAHLIAGLREEAARTAGT